MDHPPGGHDGPYDAPIITARQTVLPDWIDYNGHMNVAYYTLALDRAMDDLFDTHLGIGEALAREARMGPYALQAHVHYRAELLEGDVFHGRITLLDHDAKRVHVHVELVRDRDGTVAFTGEKVAMNVDLEARRPAPYPEWAEARLARMRADHAGLPRSRFIGAPIGLRRKS
ncbi:MAG: thioesterase family protein [Rubricella sp.]